MLRSTILVVASVALTAITLVALAGPLDPPAGPPAPTFKTLDEVEARTPISGPTTINQPGSYYLTQNITVASGNAINITAGNVTLDLNGFTIDGSTTANSGVRVATPANAAPVTIRNGSLRRFSFTGIESTNNATIVVESITTTNNAIGISASGNAVVRDVIAANNSSTGVIVEAMGLIENTLAQSNGADGFSVVSGTLRNSIARANNAVGFRLGVFVNPELRVVLVDCIAEANAENGFEASSTATFTNCIANANTGSGFLTSEPAQFTRCIARGNIQYGYFIDDPSDFAECLAENNGLAGFFAAGDFTDCEARSNGTNGFEIIRNSTITNSSATENFQNGFSLLSTPGTRITNSLAQLNASAGITATVPATIDSCTVIENAIGIAAGTGSLVIRNNASLNTTNYSIAGADHGPITDLTTSSGAFSTDSPWANFAH